MASFGEDLQLALLELAAQGVGGAGEDGAITLAPDQLRRVVRDLRSRRGDFAQIFIPVRGDLEPVFKKPWLSRRSRITFQGPGWDVRWVSIEPPQRKLVHRGTLRNRSQKKLGA